MVIELIVDKTKDTSLQEKKMNNVLDLSQYYLYQTLQVIKLKILQVKNKYKVNL